MSSIVKVVNGYRVVRDASPQFKSGRYVGTSESYRLDGIGVRHDTLDAAVNAAEHSKARV